MAPSLRTSSSLVNSLVTPSQLSISNSAREGIPQELETSAIFLGARMTQIAGILLRLPQEIAAQAIVLFTRFWIGESGGSLRVHAVKDISAATIFLSAKLSTWPKTPRSITNAYAYIDSLPSLFIDKDEIDADMPESYYVSEGTYYARKSQLLKAESALLRALGFRTSVTLPYALCINYLQTLGVFGETKAQLLAKRAWEHLNSALFSPQLLYLTHQPNALATAAIYLAAKEVGVKLPADQWWEVFDTDREELGFLVVAYISMKEFVLREQQKWADKALPLTISALETAIMQQNEANGD